MVVVMKCKVVAQKIEVVDPLPSMVRDWSIYFVPINHPSSPVKYQVLSSTSMFRSILLFWTLHF